MEAFADRFETEVGNGKTTRIAIITVAQLYLSRSNFKKWKLQKLNSPVMI